MAANTKGKNAGKSTAQNKTVGVKAADVMAVNEDGSMEPLTEAIPEIGPNETVYAGIPAQRAPQGAVYVTPKDPTVRILYLDSAIENNEIPIGGGRVITGSGRVFSVTLTEFEGTFQTPLVMKLLKKRKFIVLDGLTKEQRKQYGVDYQEGEIVKNEGMFDLFLSEPVDKAAALFAQLCPEHREMVASRISDAYDKHENRISRDRIVALNNVSKGDFPDGKGALSPILEELNRAAL